MKVFYKIFTKPIVPIISIEGCISNHQYNHVQKSLQKINVHRAKAISIIINSDGGDPYFTGSIRDLIVNFGHHNHLPTYSFVHNSAQSSAAILALSCDYTYVNEHSALGMISPNIHWFSVENILPQKSNLFVSSSSENIFNHINYAKGKTAQSVTIAKDIIKHCETQLISQLPEKIKNNQNELSKLINNVLCGKELAKNGFVTGIGTCEATMMRHFPQCKIEHINTISSIDKLKDYGVYMGKFLRFGAVNLIFIYLFYKILMLFLKLYVLKLLWPHSKKDIELTGNKGLEKLENKQTVLYVL